MNNEHLEGVECRSPSTPSRIHDSFRTFPVRVPAALGAPRSGLRPMRGPAPRPPPVPVAPCSAHSGLCAGLLRCARALRPGFASGARSPVASAARRRPRRPGWLPLVPLRGRCRFRSALSRSPAVRGPPASAPGAAVRPRRVPLRGARRICPGFGRRSSPPGGLNPAALGALVFSRACFRSARPGPRRSCSSSATVNTSGNFARLRRVVYKASRCSSGGKPPRHTCEPLSLSHLLTDHTACPRVHRAS